MSTGLTKRWNELKPHPEQFRLWNEDTRFRVVHSGRRSGKTELAKRYLVKEALSFTKFPDGWFVCAAPTRAQAKRIFWRDIKQLVPPSMRIGKPNETDMSITLINGAEITVLGLDEPARIEGRPLDGIIIDEYGNMKSHVWTAHVRPALSTPGRLGWAWLIGVPEGRNHYYHIANDAKSPDRPEWESYHWISADILDPEEIEQAKRDMDRRTYQQEYEGKFVDFGGRAYYPFTKPTHAYTSLKHIENRDLIFCFDFNVSPGVCAICQEQTIHDYPENYFNDPLLAPSFTAVISEVYIPKDSNTPRICNKLGEDWKKFYPKETELPPRQFAALPNVLLYGDATGGAKGTSQIEGSDWDIIRQYLSKHFPKTKLKMRVGRQNPKQKVRLNSVNARLQTADDKKHLLVDPYNAPMVVLDLEGVTILDGTAGEIDKTEKTLSHISDALGYYIAEKFPVRTGNDSAEEWVV